MDGVLFGRVRYQRGRLPRLVFFLITLIPSPKPIKLISTSPVRVTVSISAGLTMWKK